MRTFERNKFVYFGSNVFRHSEGKLIDVYCTDYFTSVGGRTIAISVFVCLSACLASARIHNKRHVQISQNVLYTLPVAMVRFSSDDSVIRYALPVLWMTPCFNIIDQWQKSSTTLSIVEFDR